MLMIKMLMKYDSLFNCVYNPLLPVAGFYK